MNHRQEEYGQREARDLPLVDLIAEQVARLHCGRDNLTDENQMGDTPFLEILRKREFEAAKLLLLHSNAESFVHKRNIKWGMNYRSALYYPCDGELMDMLIDKAGMDVNDAVVCAWSPLIIAIIDGDEARAIELLARGANPNLASSDGRSPLYYAFTEWKSETLVRELVSHGADLQQTLEWVDRGERYSVFHRFSTELCKRPWFEEHSSRIVRFLKSTYGSSVDLDVTSSQNETLLYLAAEQEHTLLVQALVECGANLNITDLNGCSAFYKAVVLRHATIVDYLIDCPEIDLNLRTTYGRTALFSAIDKRDYLLAMRMMKNGAKDHDSFSSAFKQALYSRDAAFLNHLIREHETSINVQEQSRERNAAMHWLATQLGFEDQTQVAMTLVQFGANVDLQNGLGETPLMLALRGNVKPVFLNYLLGLTKAVNLADGGGRSTLHYAIEKNSLDIVKTLLKMGARVEARDYDGVSVFMYSTMSKKRNRLSISQHLLEMGADINSQDVNGNTALHKAISSSSGDKSDLVKFLVRKGADFQTLRNHAGLTAWDCAQTEERFTYAALLRDAVRKQKSSKSVLPKKRSRLG